MQKQYFYIVLLVLSICLESHSQENSQKSEDEEEEEPQEKVMDHTFVALIDIVYTDGSKRSCTGAIIDDNVVITAAHCFVIDSDPETLPELTASFVVIGTKKMFDTGYERYLPIERVITHPKFHGWSADLSLVFTFAAMTADKPGTVIPLARERTATHFDTNATVFSWGRYGEDDKYFTKALSTKFNKEIENADDKQEKKQSSCGSDEDAKDEPEKSKESKEKDESFSKETYKHRGYRKARPELQNRPQKYAHQSLENLKFQHNVERLRTTSPSRDGIKRFRITRSTQEVKQIREDRPKKVISRYLASDDEILPKSPENYDEVSPKPSTNYEEEANGRRLRPKPEQTTYISREFLDSYLESIWNKFASTQKVAEKTTETPDTTFESYYKRGRRKMSDESQEEPETKALDPNFKSYYKNWRRQMPTQQNSLIVEIFGFVNTQVCKRLIEKGMSSSNDITQEKDFLCYASNEHHISDRDSGAPAVRHGQLVAVTVGGVECDGDHVGIGMKIACYCSWIAEHVPNGKNMTCCKNCCDTKEEKRKATKDDTPRKNKYLLR